MKDRLDNTYEFLSDLVTTDYKEGEFDFDRSKRHKERSLFSSGNNFKEEYVNSIIDKKNYKIVNIIKAMQ
jgi:hypothetical protein